MVSSEGPILKSNKKPNIHTHYFPRKCVCPSKQHPCVERDGGSGRTQLKMTLYTCFHVYLHSYHHHHHHHHPVFSSTESEHSILLTWQLRTGQVVGRPLPQHHSGREDATMWEGGPTTPSPLLPSKGHLDSSKVRCKRQGK